MARLTSSWVIAPTPRPMTRSTTSSPTSILSSASSRASTDPDTSPLMMSSSSCRSPDFSADSRSSRVTLGRRCANRALRSRASRRSATCRATRSSATTRKLSPAPGTLLSPSTCTGRDGGASETGSPFSSSSARTRPNASPHTIESLTWRVPRCTSTVATGPRPRSRCASIATPCASWSGLARRSSSASAVRMIASSRSGMPVPSLADTSTNRVVPPNSSATKPYSVSWARTRAGSAPSLSILLTATTTGTLAAWAWLSASVVCGFTPSSAATTSTTRSVVSAPRARLAVHLGGNLVGADVLGDAARLAGHHVGVPDGVEQLGLAVVNVTHDGNHRRAWLQVGFLALVLTELDMERLEQLLVLLLRRHDLDVVVQLGTEQLQRLVVHRLGGGDHLAEVEQHLDQRRRVHPDLVGEVTQRRTPGQPDDLAVAARDLHAADRRCLHVVELLAPLLARLAALGRTPARAPEGALGATAAAALGTATRPAAAATAHAGTRWAAATGPGTRAGTTTAAGAGASRAAGAAWTTTARAAGATTTWAAAGATTTCRARRHVARAGPRPAGPWAAWPLYIRRSGPPGSATGPRACLPRRCPRHRAGLAAPRRGRTRCYAHAGSGLAVGVVARARPGTGGGRATRSALPAGPWLPWAWLRCSPLRRGRPWPCGRWREGDLRCRCRRAGRRGLRCRCRGFGRPGRSLLARC